ncbi:hypothetical protein GCM10022276_11340 [Sphingomonas limnosediminicola]|jgi:hypothetical protein|uniref:Uncharacterized protein n=1 Tax=Sphingomonas limnosediminicola TaxID=940133 RepID=A0ABP7L4N6_9SPHN
MLREPETGSDELLSDEPGFPHKPEIIFSLADGLVSASWPGTATRVVLGPYDGVKAMMQDFLDQSALGDRLAKRALR